MPSKRGTIYYDIPLKAKVQGAHQYLSAKGIPHDVRDIFKESGVRSERAGYKMLEEGASSLSRTGQGIELMFLGIGLGDQDVFINKAIAR